MFLRKVSMRWVWFLIPVIALSALYGGYRYVVGYPAAVYTKWIERREWDFYYRIPNFRQLLMAPVEIQEIPPYREDYVQLWRDFQIGNSTIPLPVRHPLFSTIPILEATAQKSQAPHLGVVVKNVSGRELSRIYTFPLTFQKDYTLGQGLFKLPYFRNRILRMDEAEVWRDLFTRKIEPGPKPLREMLRDLYVLHLRSKFFPAQTIRYGLTREGKALIELASRDLDYSMELVMTNENGSIYSYVIRTERQHAESRRLRSKFISSISFSPTDTAMGRIVYQEFKHLNFSRQIDQEGMLYLFSSWSQDTSNEGLLKEIIFYLEKGKVNTQHLKVFYDYAFKRYGQTFTTMNDYYDLSDPGLTLQRKIEHEARRNRQMAERAEPEPTEVKLDPKEKMNLFLKRAKEKTPAAKKDMVIH